MTNVFNVFICNKHNRQKIEDYNLPVNIEVHVWESLFWGPDAFNLKYIVYESALHSVF